MNAPTPVMRKRTDMLSASLDFGGEPIDLADYAATGLVSVAVAPRGLGKTNVGLVIAEQLAQQGWVSVLVDPEDELAALYGRPVADAEDLRRRLIERTDSILVVSAHDAAEFVPYGQVMFDVADEHRRPMFVMLDEGQLWSAPRKRKSSDGTNSLGEATDAINEFVERGRKRCIDMFITALRYSGTLHRSIFTSANLTFIGQQADPTVWSSLAPQFRSSGIDFADLQGLGTGEFICLSRRGMEKMRMPMAGALRGVALKARTVRRALPTNFRQWDRALRDVPPERLNKLDPPVVHLLGAIAGLSAEQMAHGTRALDDILSAVE